MLPALLFYVLKACGSGDYLHYISTTHWEPANPSVYEFSMMAMTIACWAWMHGGMAVFLLAAVPFFIADMRRRPDAEPPQQPS